MLKILSNLSTTKATGLDNIPCKLLKEGASIISKPLTMIFNAAISKGVFPTDWKLSKVSPIFKKGDKEDPNNYRPISVIQAVAKIFEKIIFDQLSAYLQANKLLADSQSGFRKNHSTMTALLDATDEWPLNIDKGLVNAIVFIDLKKAFDTVDHKILLTKLEMYGIRDMSLKLFESYLTDRQQKCNINGTLSNPMPISCGVPQGSALGPLLFLIYINDLPNCLQHSTPRMYADDTGLTIASISPTEIETKMNTDLSNINKWLYANKLSLNIAKTEFMLVTSRQKLRTMATYPKININGQPVTEVEVSESLGLHIDNTLSWNNQIDHITKKVSAAIGAIKRIRPFVTQTTLLSMYHSWIQPHFDYCSEVWGNIGVVLTHKLQKLQNRAVRIITSSTYDTSSRLLRNSLSLDDLSTRRAKLKATQMYRIVNNAAPDYLTAKFKTLQEVVKYEKHREDGFEDKLC